MLYATTPKYKQLYVFLQPSFLHTFSNIIIIIIIIYTTAKRFALTFSSYYYDFLVCDVLCFVKWQEPIIRKVLRPHITTLKYRLRQY